MKKWLFLILLFPLICVAQTYRYLGVEDGLSNRRVYCIQKDKTGYMWFLTHEGIDRYNGKEFKRYKLMDGDAEVNSLLNLNWLYIDQEGVLWEIGKKGKVFRYDQIHDCFSLVYKLPMESFSEQPDPVTYAWLDQNKHIWLCNKDTIFLYNTDTKQVTHIKNDISEEITDIEQIDESHFFIGTEMGIHYAQLENNDGHKGVVLHSPTVGRRYYPTDCFVIWQTIFLNEQNYFFWLEMSLESAQVTFS